MSKGATRLYFETPAQLRAWFEEHHARVAELHVEFHKRHAVRDGVRCITWPESVAEALCFGWIDGVRRSLGKDRYAIRFTPRRKGSKWSAVNVKLMAELERTGRMTAAGRAVFEARKDPGSPGYRAQKKVGELDEARLLAFKKRRRAWTFFEAQPPGYRKAAAWWVMHAKQEATRDRRLETLVEASERGERVK